MGKYGMAKSRKFDQMVTNHQIVVVSNCRQTLSFDIINVSTP